MKLLPREAKFWLINHLVLPPLLVVMKVLARTWRLSPEARAIAESFSKESRLVVNVYHGHSPLLIPVGRYARSLGKTTCVMTSPSRDGKAFDRILKAFGLTVVKGSSKSRAVGGAKAMIREIEQGRVGLVACDGPRGPISVPKSGFVGMAMTTGARSVFVLGKASRYWMVPSWDKMVIPAPFSTIEMVVVDFPLSEADREDPAAAAERLRVAMLKASQEFAVPYFKDIPLEEKE